MKGLWDIFVSVFQITQTHKGVQGVHTCWELQPIYFIDRDLTHHLNNNWTGMGRECKNIRPQKPRIRALLLTTAQKHLLLHSWQAAQFVHVHFFSQGDLACGTPHAAKT